MTTTSSTRNLVRAIEGLSQNLTEIASILKDAPEDAADAAGTAETTEKQTGKTAAAKTDPEKETGKKAAPAAAVKPEKPSSGSGSGEEGEVTFEDIRAVLSEKTQDGMTAKIRELLNSFGAAKLSKVPKEKYPELMKAAKALK